MSCLSFAKQRKIEPTVSNDIAISLKKGEVAPFDGVLVNKEDVKLLINEAKRCQ